MSNIKRTKSYIEYLNRKGADCWVCGKTTFGTSYVSERDGHVHHCDCVPVLHLIGLGDVAAIPAEDVKVGMTITWNYGTQSTVVSAAKKSERSVNIIERYADGTEYSRLFRPERLIAAR